MGQRIRFWTRIPTTPNWALRPTNGKRPIGCLSDWKHLMRQSSMPTCWRQPFSRYYEERLRFA